MIQLLAIMAILAVAFASDLAGMYEQCGGKGYKGPTECVAGWECIKSDKYYSQCRPKPDDKDKNTAGNYAQCGGLNFKGCEEDCDIVMSCQEGWHCQPQDGNPYYSQCLPNYAQEMMALAKKSKQVLLGDVAGSYEQCAGKGYKGPTTCQVGWECVKSDKYYSQCRPIETTPTDTTAGNWAQCGGEGFNGCVSECDTILECGPGWTCTPQEGNKYYSQCLYTGTSLRS